MNRKSNLHILLPAICIILTACGSTAAANSSSRVSTSVTSLSTSAKTLFPQGITLVAGTPPGGPTYTEGSVVQPFLQSILHVPVTIRPVLGGGGKSANQYVYSGSPTSGILLLTYLPQLPVGQLVGGGKDNTLKFTPIAGLFGNDTSIYVSKYGSKYKNFASLQNSKSVITIGVFGVKSSAGWMSAQFLSKINHIKTATVPFANGAQSVDGVLSGAVDLASIVRAQAIPLIAAKKVQPVVEFAPSPLSFLPGTESIAQVGSAGEAFSNTLGIDGPPHMSAAAVRVLTGAFSIMGKDPSYIAKAKKLSLSPVYENAAAWEASKQAAYNLVKSHMSIL